MYELLGRRASKILAWVVVAVFLVWAGPFAIKQTGFSPTQIGNGLLTWEAIRDLLLLLALLFGALGVASLALGVMLGFIGRLTGIALYRREIQAMKADIAAIKQKLEIE